MQRSNEPCSVSGCESRIVAKGYCGKHYQRALKHGNPETVIVDFPRAHYKGSPFHVIDALVYIDLGGDHSPTVVDRNDFFALGLDKYTYRPHRDGHVRTFVDGKECFLHQLILGKETGLVCDHIDGDPLNNTKSNLRFATHQQNTFNRKVNCLNRSGSRGVYRSISFGHRPKPWRATLKFCGKQVLSRFFSSEEEAIEARQEAEKKYFGEFNRSIK